MKFLVVTFAPTIRQGGKLYSYAPYVREMDMWFSAGDQIEICSPTVYSGENLLLAPFQRDDIQVRSVPEISFVGIRNKLRAICLLPIITFKLWISFFSADHIHFRSPGNISLLGLIVQIFFPWKKKTAKYAGNWGENKGQPRSYRFQKWILSNTFLTHNMQVLVYGQWPHQSKNVVPFFTASYSEKEIIPVTQRNLQETIKLVFVGMLMKNKNPLTAIQVAEVLVQNGINVHLDLLGDGPERSELENYVIEKKLSDHVQLHGNVPAAQVKSVLQAAHFLVFLSNSEGWPKAVAEAMFWGCVPLTKPVSCVPWMLAEGKRGILADSMQPADLAQKIIDVTKNKTQYEQMASEGALWARQYTLEKFEAAIREMV